MVAVCLVVMLVIRLLLSIIGMVLISCSASIFVGLMNDFDFGWYVLVCVFSWLVMFVSRVLFMLIMLSVLVVWSIGMRSDYSDVCDDVLLFVWLGLWGCLMGMCMLWVWV